MQRERRKKKASECIFDVPASFICSWWQTAQLTAISLKWVPSQNVSICMMAGWTVSMKIRHLVWEYDGEKNTNHLKIWMSMFWLTVGGIFNIFLYRYIILKKWLHCGKKKRSPGDVIWRRSQYKSSGGMKDSHSSNISRSQLPIRTFPLCFLTSYN